MPVIIEPTVTMYRSPDLLSETVSQAKMGESVEILEDTNTDFYLIKTLWDNYTGFVPKKSVDQNLMSWNPSSSVITASLANLVYSSAKVQSPIIARLPLGIKLELLDPGDTNIESDWFWIKLCNGLTGFIQKGDVCFPDQLKFKDIPSLRHSLVHWASKFEEAVPYLWGGTSSFGIDCSGFVQHIYRLHDLPLERDASQIGQGIYLTNIKREDVLPGDLIFFEGYGHVGLAISHFSFIHATVYQRPVVQVSEIDSPYWLEKTIQYSRYKFKK